MSKTSNVQQNPGCLGAVLSFLGIHPGKSEKSARPGVQDDDGDHLFRVRDDFLSPAEQVFYQAIRRQLDVSFTICPKVSLGDLFYVTNPHENYRAYNKINRKHVDYLVCDSLTMRPVFAVELDDSSHQRSDRVERDALVDEVYKSAGLPLIHVPVRGKYNPSELEVIFSPYLTSRPVLPEPPLPASAALGQPPLCPKCGIPLVLRQPRSTSRSSKLFYGCSNYPKCRVVVPVEEKSK